MFSASNVTEFDALIDDRLLFIDPDGGVYRKADASFGRERLTPFGPGGAFERAARGNGYRGDMCESGGVFKGHAFEGDYRYISRGCAGIEVGGSWLKGYECS